MYLAYFIPGSVFMTPCILIGREQSHDKSTHLRVDSEKWCRPPLDFGCIISDYVSLVYDIIIVDYCQGQYIIVCRPVQADIDLEFAFGHFALVRKTIYSPQQ